MTDSQFGQYVEQVREKSPLLAVVVDLLGKADGANPMYICPFHADNKPSLSINARRHLFHCFGCHASGDVFRFMELREGLTFRQAVDRLAQRAGLPAYRPHPQEAQLAELARAVGYVTEWVADYYRTRLAPGTPAYTYLTEARGLPAGLVADRGLGWADGGAVGHVAGSYGAAWVPVVAHAGLAAPLANAQTWVEGAPTHRDWLFERVVFPSMEGGRPTFLSGRALDPARAPKYLHQRGVEAPLYNEDVLYEAPARVLVTEGPLDALSLLAWGYPVVGLQGGFRVSAVRKLKLISQVCVCLDADRAGYQSAMKLAIALGADRLRIVGLPPGQDPNDYYRQRTREEFDALVVGALDPVEFGLALVPPRATPAVARQALDPVVHLLAALPSIATEGYLQGIVQPALKLDKAALAAWREEIVAARAEHRVRCPACDTTLHHG